MTRYRYYTSAAIIIAGARMKGRIMEELSVVFWEDNTDYDYETALIVDEGGED